MRHGQHKFKHLAWSLALVLAAGGGAARANANELPLVRLHLTFDAPEWVAYSAGPADFFCSRPQAAEGHAGAGARIDNPEQAGRVETPFNLDKARGTITLWYKPEFPRGKSPNYQLLWTGENPAHGENSLWLWLNGGSLRFDVRDPKDKYCTTPLKDWEPGQWVHIAAAWDHEKGLSLWVNGQKKAEREATWTPKATTPLLIGTGNYGGALTASGTLDELKIYDRPLTAEQIQADFTGNLALTPAPAATADQLAALKKPVVRRESEPLETLFHLDFEHEFAAQAAGEKEPTNANRPTLVPGIAGSAGQFAAGQVLRYLEAKNIRKECGSISVWVQTPIDGNAAPDWLHIFREDGPGDVGKNALWLWLWPENGLRWDPRDNNDSYTVLPPSARWKKGEWHHIVAEWDSQSGTVVYVDGKQIARGGGGDGDKSFIPVTWEPVEHPAFLIGARSPEGGQAWLGAIDEFKIFSRPLTTEEVRAEYGRFRQVAVDFAALDPYLWAGEKETLQLAFENLKGQAVKYQAEYTLKDAAGAAMAQGELGEISLEKDARVHVPLELALPTPGAYDLSVTVKNATESQDFGEKVYALARQEPATATANKLILVDEVDPVELTALVESAPSQIVESPLGKYREAGPRRNDRFALKFKVQELHVPHVAVVTYPDDKPRTMEAMLQPLDVSHDYQAQTGVYTGDEYPLSNKMLEQKILFWPQCENLSFIFMTVEKDHPAAVQSLKIYKLEGGFTRLPVKPFTGSVPARQIGLYHEDPVFAICYGTLPGKPDMHFFPGFATVIDRMLDYHQSFGMSTVHYPICWYHGPLFGSEAEPLTTYGGRPHPAGFPKYLLRRLEARGMKFDAWFHEHQIDSLLPYTILDDDRVMDGEETVINMRGDNRLFYRAWHGKDPVYNPLDPRVQAAIKRQFAEIIARYGDEPALSGLTLNTVRHSIFAFGSLDSGYNDCNLRRFQEETGIKIPVDMKDRYRFAKSHQWLMDNVKEEWIKWRCQKLHDYYKELAAMLRAKRPELTLGLVVFAAEDGKAGADYLDPNQARLRPAREQGIDPALYVNDPEIVIRYCMVPADLRWRRGHGRDLFGIDDVRTVDSSPEMVAPIAATPSACVNMHDRYFEDPIAKGSPLKGLSDKVKECGWRVSALNANTFHGLENHAFAMNNLDPLVITKGGFLVGSLGIEDEIGRFAQAYRALPAVKFADVAELADPVRVRQQVVDGRNYFYVLNRLPYPVEVSIRLSGADAADLVSGEKSAGGQLNLKLSPYDLRSFCQEGAGRVEGGAATTPADLIAELEKRVAEAGQQFDSISGQGIDLSTIKPYLEKARACLAEKQYARLFFLLQESWLPKMKQLTDKTLQSFLHYPTDYLEKQVQVARTLTAVRAAAAPTIDGEFSEADWAKAPICDQMSDFLNFQGRFMAMPAQQAMKVRLLYDDRALYVGVECADPAPAQITVKPGQRDGSPWSDDDAVEIFLRSPEMGSAGHAQLAVNAGSSRTDLYHGSMGWNGDWQAASKVTATGWQTEVAVPFAVLGKELTAASGWAFNIARTRRDFPKSALVGDTTSEWKCEARFAQIQMQ